MTSKMKFKVGDRVKCVRSTAKHLIGKTGTVTLGTDADFVIVRLDKPYHIKPKDGKKKDKGKGYEVKVLGFDPKELERLDAAPSWGQEKI